MTITAKQLAADLELTPKAFRRKVRKAQANGLDLGHSKGDRYEFSEEAVEAITLALATTTVEEAE